MKTSSLIIEGTILCSLLLFHNAARGQSTAFTYQGRIHDGGTPYTGVAEFQATLWNAVSNGTLVAASSPASSVVPVTNGLFVLPLDFGTSPFSAGANRWLQLEVRTTIGPFSTLSPRQPLTPTPYSLYAGSAATATIASNVASGVVVGTLNGLKDNVVLQAGSNVTITPTGNTLTISSAGAGGSGIWSVLNNNAYYTAGAVAIGTATPTPGVLLDVIGPARVATGGSGGYLSIGSPNGESGLGVIGNNRFDLRFDGSTVKLVAGAGTAPPIPEKGITINTNGNVGVGMGSPLPASQWKLEVNGPVRMTPGGSGGAVQFSAPSGESGMSIIGANRADLRFDGSTLKLVAGAGTAPPSPTSGIAISTAGDVGIGAATPGAKLHAETSQASRAAVYGNATGLGGVGVYAQGASGAAVHAQGNATQARDKGGFVKAMLYVSENGQIRRCYNGVTGQATSGCGFTVTHLGVGIYRINFGFQVSDRFVSITPHQGAGNLAGYNYGANFAFFDASTVDVLMFDANDGDDTHSNPFMIFIY